MQFFRSLFLLLSISLIVFANWYCTDTAIPVTAKTENKTDPRNGHVGQTFDNSYNLTILENVKLTQNDNSVTYEFRQTAGYSCNVCFSPPTVTNDSFSTPAASRYEGTTLVETVSFKFSKGVSWKCQDPNHAGYFHIYRNTTQYLNEHHLFGCVSDASCTGLSTGSYSNVNTGVSLPASSTIHVQYGIDVLTGGDCN